MAITVECEHCGARLKLKDDSKVGKKVPCPKCKEPFVVQPLDEDEFDLAGEEDEEEVKPAPKKKSPAARKKGSGKGKKSKSAEGSPLGLIIGGVLLLLVAVGVGFWAMGMFKGSEPAVAEAPPAEEPAEPMPAPPPPPPATIDFTYLPPDTDVVVRLNGSDLMKAPLMAELLAMPETQSALDDAKMQLGIGLDQITSITLGISKVFEETSKIAAEGGMAAPAPGAAQNPFANLIPPIPGLPKAAPDLGLEKRLIVVVRTATPVDLSKIQGIDTESPLAEVNGSKVYQGPDGVAVLAAKPDTLILGEPELVKQAIAWTDGSGLAKRFSAAQTQSHALVAACSLEAIPACVKIFEEGMQEIPAALQGFKEQYDKGVRGVLFAVGVTDALSIRFGVDAPTGADAVKTEMQTQLTDLQSQIEESADSIPEAVRSSVVKIVKGMSVVSAQPLTAMDIQVSKADLESLQAAGPALLPIAMMAAAGGPGKGPNRRPGGGAARRGPTTQPADASFADLEDRELAGESAMPLTDVGDTAAADAADGTNFTPDGGADVTLPGTDDFNYDAAAGNFGAEFGVPAIQRQGGMRRISLPQPLTKASTLPPGVTGMVSAGSTVVGRQPVVGVDLIFPATETTRVVGYTLNKVSKVSDDAGAPLRPVRGNLTSLPGPNDFVPVDYVELAPDQLAPAIPATLIGTAAVRQLSSGEGTVRLQLAGKSQNVLLEDLHTSVGQLTDAAEPGSLGIRAERGPDGELLLFSSRTDAVLTKVQAIDVNQLPLPNVSVSADLRGSAPVYVLKSTGNQPLPIPLTVSLDVASELSTTDFNYAFSSVPLTGQQSVPGVASQEIASERKAPEVEGGRVTGQLRWGPENEKKIPTLEVVVQMSGTPFENSVSSGRYVAEPCLVGSARLPPLPKDLNTGYVKRPQGFDPLDSTGKMADECEAYFAFVVPPRGTIEAISSFSGSVKIRRSAALSIVQIPSLESAVGQPLSDAKLTEAKIALNAAIEGDTVVLTMTDGDHSLIRTVGLTGPTGAPLPIADTKLTVERRIPVWTLKALRPEQLSGAGLRLELFTEITEVNVPFLFKNLKVPSASNQLQPRDSPIDGTDPMFIDSQNPADTTIDPGDGRRRERD